MLSFFFYFKRSKEIEHTLREINHFDYSTKRGEWWKNKETGCKKDLSTWGKSLVKPVSFLGAANKVFCFLVPCITYAIWGTLLVFISKRECGSFSFWLLIIVLSVIFVYFIFTAITISKIGRTSLNNNQKNSPTESQS